MLKVGLLQSLQFVNISVKLNKMRYGCIWKDVHSLYANTTPFYISDEHLWIMLPEAYSETKGRM